MALYTVCILRRRNILIFIFIAALPIAGASKIFRVLIFPAVTILYACLLTSCLCRALLLCNTLMLLAILVILIAFAVIVFHIILLMNHIAFI
jgi:hypothetical protein